jgi:hypothetical protein
MGYRSDYVDPKPRLSALRKRETQMGEAKRRKPYDTLDGGPPSSDRIAFELRTFSPGPDLFLNGDKHVLAATREVYRAMRRRPTPICSACDYEFEFSEWPPLAYYMVPAFPKADNYTIIAGAICGQCARLPNSSLRQALFHYLRAGLAPGMEILATQ